MALEVTIGDAPSIARDISPDDYAIGWMVTGPPADAVALDTYRTLLETRLRAILTAIIQTDAPGSIVLDDLRLNGTIIELDYTVGGQAAQVDVDLSALFYSQAPELIALVGNDGDSLAFPHGNHAHALPRRGQTGQVPLIVLDHLAAASAQGFGKLLGFNATTGVPEYQDPSPGTPLSDNDPVPVGGVNAPVPGIGAASSKDDHGHTIAAESVGLTEIKPAADVADYGKVIGYDLTTGAAIAILPGQSSFLTLTDTAAAFGLAGQAPVVNPGLNGLVFAGPFAPLVAPPVPTNQRVTDAFDTALATAWDASTGAEAYEWQRKLSSDLNWPGGNGTRTTALTARNTAPLAAGTYDVRVRAVGVNSSIRSAWVELLNIPLITTPAPGVSTGHALSRAGSGTLRFDWDNLDVNNGGTGAARVVKTATYQIEWREVGAANWGAPSAVAGATHQEVSSLVNGTQYEMRVRGLARRSDGTNTDVEGQWSAVSNQEKPVKNTVTLTYGVAATRTGPITSPRTLELTPGTGSEIEITNASHPAVAGEFYVLDIARGEEYGQTYNILVLETRPLPSDITAGAAYMAEAEPATGTGPRRYSVGPAVDITATQRWLVEV